MSSNCYTYHLSRSFRQELLNQLEVRLALIWLYCGIVSCKTSIMLDGVRCMQAEICQIEAVGLVRFVQKAGAEVWDEKAKGRGKVERLSDFVVHLREADVLAVVWKDAMICLENDQHILDSSSATPIARIPGMA